MTSLSKIEFFIHENITKYRNNSQLLRDVAYFCLRDAILSLDVTSGDVLSEVKLSDALGISRTPTRAAIQQLVHEGLLDSIPGRAIVIASRSIEQALEALHVRELLEPDVCRLAALHMSNEQNAALESFMQQLEAAASSGNRAVWTLVDVEWHEAISAACPNRLLAQMTLQAKVYMHKQGVSSKISDEYLKRGTREHREVVDAIIEHDGERAAERMFEHLRSAKQHLLQSHHM